MRSLKHKASHFFRDGPSQDEKAANSHDGFDFDAGIQDRSAKKKASRFFLRKQERLDKPLPAPPSNTSSTTLPSEQQVNCDNPHGRHLEDDLDTPEKSLLFSPVHPNLVKRSRPNGYIEDQRSQISPPNPASPKAKSHPRLATLRSKSSRLFRSRDYGSHSPPRPPLPQIPVSPEEPTPPRPALVPLHSLVNSPRSSIVSSSGRRVSISSPVLLQQSPAPLLPKYLTRVHFTKPPGPSPHRPPRPDSIDDATLALLRENGTRILPPTYHTSASGSISTATDSTPRSATSSINSRLGFPTGHGPPRKNSLESSLAVRLPYDPRQPLPVRTSDGSLTYSRFSEYIRTQHRGYAIDGVDAEDRDMGPIEQYAEGKEEDWKLAKRLSRGPGSCGTPGMLFRDRWNGFHFVADV